MKLYTTFLRISQKPSQSTCVEEGLDLLHLGEHELVLLVQPVFLQLLHRNGDAPDGPPVGRGVQSLFSLEADRGVRLYGPAAFEEETLAVFVHLVYFCLNICVYCYVFCR